MLIVPLRAVPSQRLTIGLGNQACQIEVKQRSYGVYLDLQVNNSPVVTGALCVDRVRVVRSQYAVFSGDLAFVDTRGRDDPVFTGLGDRFLLLYLNPDEVDAARTA